MHRAVRAARDISSPQFWANSARLALADYYGRQRSPGV